MKVCVFGILLFLIAFCHQAYAISELPVPEVPVLELPVSELPVWGEEERELLQKGEIIPGRALLTKEGVPAELLIDSWREEREQVEPLPEVPSVIEPTPELPDPQHLLDDRVNLTADILMQYFDRRPEHFLIDTQELLSRQEWRDINYTLERHQNVSPISVYVYIFGKEQKVPEAYWPEIVFEENFMGTEESCAIVYYHFGAPERSRFYLGGGGLADIELWKKKEILSNSRMKARDKSAAFSQLEDFIGQISMRLYWIEEDYKRKEKERLAAIEDHVTVEAERSPGFLDYLEQWLPFMEGVYPKIAAGGTLISLCGVGWILWIKNRKFVFPEVESKPRLGGMNGAGFGGVLSFKDPLVPPSAQREQFEELL